MRWHVWAMAGLLAGGFGSGCDDRNDIPPEVLKAQQQPPLPATRPGPTTRELLDGPKKILHVGEFPLTLDVPQSWNLRSMGNGEVITVGGPATSGDIDIQLVQQNNVGVSAGPDASLAAANKEAQAKPHPINFVELRPLGTVKVLESRTISNAFVNGKLPAEIWGEASLTDDKRLLPAGVKNSTLAILNPHMVKWSFTVFIPAGEKKFNVRGLTFMGLSLHDFERDREFLEQMMKTLKYEE